MSFFETVGAYLVGWVIAHGTYFVLTRKARKRLDDEMVARVAEALDQRRTSEK